MHKVKQQGFTIVELLIVVVVIAILAAITMVVYSSLNDKAIVAVLESDLSQLSTKLSTDKVEGGSFPTNSSSLQLTPNNGITYEYTSDGSTFCLSAKKGKKSYHITEASRPEEGVCVGHAGPGGITPLVFLSPGGSRNATGLITLHSTTNASVVPFDGGNAWLLTSGTKVRLPAGLPWYTDGYGAPFGIYIRMAVDTYPDTTLRFPEEGIGHPDWPATARYDIGPTGIRSRVHNSIAGTLIKPGTGQPISLYMGRSRGSGKNYQTIINGVDQTGSSSYEGETRWLTSDRVELSSSTSTIVARVAAAIWFDRPLTNEELSRINNLSTEDLTWDNIVQPEV